MNWQEIAGGLVNALRNAGVKKDVIDLQEKQLALLTDELAVLTRKLAVSATERANLESKVQDLEEEIALLRPSGSSLDEISAKLLQSLARAGGEFVLGETANALGLQWVKARYHADILAAQGMIKMATQRWGHGRYSSLRTVCTITPKGTAFVVENGLV